MALVNCEFFIALCTFAPLTIFFYPIMKSALPYLLLLLAPGFLSAGIEIQDVNFTQTRSKAIVMSVELKAARDSATRDKFISDISVAAYVAWGEGGKTDPASLKFYRSAAEIVAIEVNQTATVPFVLAGVVADRDELRADPFAYYLEIKVGEETIPFNDDMVSQTIRGNAAAIRSIKERSDGEAGLANDGLFVPYYLSTYGLEGVSFRDLPYFKRPEATLLFE